jgi:hypothetical protein
MTTWLEYLAYLRAQASRRALQSAILADEHTLTVSNFRHVEGQGEVQVVFIPAPQAQPWPDEVLAQYESLQNGGEWPQALSPLATPDPDSPATTP